MEIEFDPVKRAITLTERGLDMADAALVLRGTTITIPDERRAYGEDRFLSVGRLRGRMVFVVWTPRGSVYRIISMRKANEREQATYGPRLR